MSGKALLPLARIVSAILRSRRKPRSDLKTVLRASGGEEGRATDLVVLEASCERSRKKLFRDLVFSFVADVCYEYVEKAFVKNCVAIDFFGMNNLSSSSHLPPCHYHTLFMKRITSFQAFARV